MQSFLPYPPEIDTKTGVYSFRNSAKVLDPIRLNKQCLEGYQILKRLLDPSPTGGWKNHPAVLQWKGYEYALYRYIMDMCAEHISRGGKTVLVEKTNELINDDSNRSLPKWMGRKDIHSSHRSRLLFKGRVDSLVKTLRVDMGIKKPNKWLVENGFPKSNVFTIDNAYELESLIFDKTGLAELQPNYYGENQRWLDGDSLPYVWPVTIAQIREEQKRLIATT
jgi:hypothetical protein